MKSLRPLTGLATSLFAIIPALFIASIASQIFISPPGFRDTMRLIPQGVNPLAFLITFFPTWAILAFLMHPSRGKFAVYMIMLAIPLCYAGYTWQRPPELFEEVQERFWQERGLNRILQVNDHLAWAGAALAAFVVISVAVHRPMASYQVAWCALGAVALTLLFARIIAATAVRFNANPTTAWTISLLLFWWLISVPFGRLNDQRQAAAPVAPEVDPVEAFLSKVK